MTESPIDVLERWEAGFKLVLGVKESHERPGPMALVRHAFYRLMRRLSPEVEQIDGFYGFGLLSIVLSSRSQRLGDLAAEQGWKAPVAAASGNGRSSRSCAIFSSGVWAAMSRTVWW